MRNVNSRGGTRGVLTALLSVVLLVALSPNSASADHGEGGLDPDNQTQGVVGFNLTTNGSHAKIRGDQELERSNITTTTGADDIEVFDYTYGDTGWYGVTDCTDWVVILGACDVMRVRFNESAMAGLSVGHWRSLGCHEFGHTGDLGHRTRSNDSDNNSCMRSDIWPQTFDTHDVNAINNSL